MPRSQYDLRLIKGAKPEDIDAIAEKYYAEQNGILPAKNYPSYDSTPNESPYNLGLKFGENKAPADPDTNNPPETDRDYPIPELDPTEVPQDLGVKKTPQGTWKGDDTEYTVGFRGFYPKDPNFDDKIDPKYSAKSSSNVGYFDVAPNLQDPNAYDRDPRDYKSAIDPFGQEAQKRYWTRAYLEQRFNKSDDREGLDKAKGQQQWTNDVADVGSALDRIVSARGASVGGRGADAAFWQGMKRDAAGRTNQANEERQQAIQNFMLKQRLGSEGVAEMDRIRKSQFEAAMQDPTSGVSRARQEAFRRMFPDVANGYKTDGVDKLEYMTGTDIDRIADWYKEKTNADLRSQLTTVQADTQRTQNLLARHGIDAKMQDIAERQERRGPELDKIKAETSLIKARSNKLGEEKEFKPTPAIQALDRKYVKDYLDWTTQDKAALERNLELLQQSKQELENELRDVGEEKSLLSGNLVGRAPDWARTEKSKKIQGDVEQAALGSIKATLSGPTSDRDVNIILSKAYDPKLSIKSNLDKINKAIDVIEKARTEKNKKAAHFEKNGSLGGYVSGSEEAPKEATTSGPKAGDVDGGYEFLGGDPSKKENWKAVK